MPGEEIAVGLIIVIAFTILAGPPWTSGAPKVGGRRVVHGQEVETNPNWGKSFATTARFGHGYGRGGPTKSLPPVPKVPDLRTRFWNSKFSANPWTFQVTPSRDLWLAQPFPLR